MYLYECSAKRGYSVFEDAICFPLVPCLDIQLFRQLFLSFSIPRRQWVRAGAVPGWERVQFGPAAYFSIWLLVPAFLLLSLRAPGRELTRGERGWADPQTWS